MKFYVQCLGMILMILLAGCSVARPVNRDASAIGALPPKSRIVVYPDSGKHYKMRFEEIRNDTLFGYTSERNVRQPRARIDSMFVVRNNPGRTIALALVSLFVADAAVLLLWLSSGP